MRVWKGIGLFVCQCTIVYFNRQLMENCLIRESDVICCISVHLKGQDNGKVLLACFCWSVCLMLYFEQTLMGNHEFVMWLIDCS